MIAQDVVIGKSHDIGLDCAMELARLLTWSSGHNLELLLIG
jgi:hypothetical protein